MCFGDGNVLELAAIVRIDCSSIEILYIFFLMSLIHSKFHLNIHNATHTLTVATGVAANAIIVTTGAQVVR